MISQKPTANKMYLKSKEYKHVQQHKTINTKMC